MLQEIKTQDENFPNDEFKNLGYISYVFGQKSYNGVAIISKQKLDKINNSFIKDDLNQSRIITAELKLKKKKIELINIYVPNGNPVDTEKYEYKKEWLKKFISNVKKKIQKNSNILIAGDFNIIPEEIDVHDFKRYENDALGRLEIRKKFRELINLGFKDVYRFKNKTKQEYTFWDYFAGSWQKNYGMRIDHFLLSNNLIEKYILKQSNVKKPNILFIPTASAEDKSYIVNFYSCFSRLECSPSHVTFFQRTPRLDSLVNKADVIYVGGGNTKSMLAVWKEWGLDKILRKAYQKGVVMSGVSAGAICWFERGLTDSWASDLKMMECMNFIPGNCAPHYDEEPERRPATKKFLQDESISYMYGIEGGAALHFVDEQPKSTIRFKKNKNAYKVTLESNKVDENPYQVLELDR